MSILYIGQNEGLFYLIMKYSEKKGIAFSKMPIQGKKISQIKDALIFRSEAVFIYDYSAFEHEEQKDFVSMLLDISNAKNNDAIIYCPMASGTKLVTSLKGVGFTKIITDSDEDNLRTSLEKYLEAPKSKTSRIEMEAIAQNREDIAKSFSTGSFSQKVLSNDNTVKIAVCGVLPRIGTTAVSLQIVKTLNLKRVDSCGYIDVQGDYFNNLTKYYYTEPIDKGIRYGEINLYQDVIRLKNEGYDYLVYDYGIIDEDINLMSILDKDIVVVVGQAGPSEIGSFTNAMSLTKDSPVVAYGFYNAPQSKEDRKEILNSMSGYEEKTFFFEHVVDPFILEPLNRNAVTSLINKMSSVEVEKKKSRLLDRIFA